MPKSIIKSETKWKEAKKKASEQGQGKNYPYIMAIYQRMADTPFKGNINTNRKDFITQSKKFKDEYDQIHNVVGEVIPNKRISTPISGLTLAGKKIFFKPKEKNESVKIPDNFYQIFTKAYNYFETRQPQNLIGGLGDNSKPSDFDYDELYKGTKIELEHTDNIYHAMEISMDHLFEIKNYYTRLSNMEKQAKKDGDFTNNKVEQTESNMHILEKKIINNYENRKKIRGSCGGTPKKDGSGKGVGNRVKKKTVKEEVGNLRQFILENFEQLNESPMSNRITASLRKVDARKARQSILNSIMRAKDAQVRKMVGIS